MSTTFNLTNTASDINTALQAVVGADTAPTDGSANMVTSNGVFDYVTTQVGALAGKTVTIEGTGIVNTDNDTSLPTSAAVVDYVANHGKPTMGSLTETTAGTRTASTDLYITLRSTYWKQSQNTTAIENHATITIENITFHCRAPVPQGYSVLYQSASFFVKKGESYTITLDNNSATYHSDKAARAYQRTFNFTP